MINIPKKKVLYYVEIENYPTKILLSKARRAKYKENKLGEKVISNKAYAGKPRYKTISGQDLWQMSLSRFVKGKMASELKEFYYERFRGLPPIEDYPIGIYLKYEGVLESKPDLDNLNMFHLKCIADCLCGNVKFDKVEDKKLKRGWRLVPDYITYPKLVVDDNLSYINEISYSFKEANVERMIITVYKNH